MHQSTVAGRNVWADGGCHIADGHGLEPHAAGAGKYGIEQALATQQPVLHIFSVPFEHGFILPFAGIARNKLPEGIKYRPFSESLTVWMALPEQNALDWPEKLDLADKL